MNQNFTLAEESTFYAPTSTDAFDLLLNQYRQSVMNINEIVDIVATDKGSCLKYFLDGNPEYHGRTTSVSHLFRKDGAISALNSEYWTKILALTDVYDCMPQARRDEWNKSIHERTTPEFLEETVRSTITGLLLQREKFFAERVDNIFRGLSGHHVTNCPEAFGKRMIIEYCLSYNSINSSRAGLINDLRCVIAKFMGRDEPKYNSSDSLMKKLYRNTGQWNTIDGGSMKIRVYKKGTAHMEIHPDMAWRLNQVLSGLYPMAIPAEFRQKVKKVSKEFVMMQRPLPFSVLEILGEVQNRRHTNKNTFEFDWRSRENKFARKEAENILESIGGVKTGTDIFSFDYCPESIIEEIVTMGCIPDYKSHQFYPTPKTVGQIAVDMADIGEDDTCMEPSAGHGGLAELMPMDRTLCIEISSLHCSILREKGFETINSDFLNWSKENSSRKFTRIVMNPPYCDKQWNTHMMAAYSHLEIGGKLSIVLPSSHKGKEFFGNDETVVEWSKTMENEFAGTSIAVVVMCVTKLK